MPNHPSRALIASAVLMAAIVASATAIACGSDDSVTVPGSVTFGTTMNGAGENPAKNVPGVAVGIIPENPALTHSSTPRGPA